LEDIEMSINDLDPETGAPAPDIMGRYLDKTQYEVEMGILEEIQDMEERMCGASLQIKVSFKGTVPQIKLNFNINIK
jgi:hypothetical protein